MLSFKYKIEKKYDLNTSKLINKYFNTNKKLTKCSLGCNFIATCLSNEKVPNFARLNLASHDLNKNKRFKTRLGMDISETELKNKRSLRRKFKTELQRIQNVLDFKIEPEEWDMLQKLVSEKSQQIRSKLETIHEKRLIELGIIRPEVINNQNISSRKNTKVNKIDKPTSIFNYSDKELTEIEETALSKGLKFGIRSKNVNQYEILARFEELAQNLNRLEITDKSTELKANH